ncbi:MAG TPA: nucleotide-binding protein [Anaerolineae bacterium]|nr:nucleotide-binding protein [Anaerolineae bacterium]
MDVTIFYSWQSDLPPSANRSFILTALERAAKTIHADESIKVEPVIDRDTLGVPGSPNIAHTILEKIEKSDIFVCDVSIINPNRTSECRSTPNPNVLIELGYATKALGHERIIMVFINKAPLELTKG